MKPIEISNKCNLNVWVISDTHGYHGYLNVPENVDVLIHCGDATNYRDQYKNKVEFDNFVQWLKDKCNHIPVKLFTPGNHDSYIYYNQKEAKKILDEVGVDLVIDNHITVYGLKIFMSPYTPAFGDWVYQVDRGKTYKRYSHAIDDDVDVVINHGMPKGILDLTEDRYGKIEQVGDKGLLTRLKELENLKLFCGGHIHDYKNIKNSGVYVDGGVYYGNCACVKDAEFHKGIQFNGNLFKF